MSKKVTAPPVTAGYEYCGPEGHSPMLGMLYTGRKFKAGELSPETERDMCARGTLKPILLTIKDEGGET